MLRWVVALPNSMKVLFFLWFALVGLFAGLLWEESKGDVHKSRSANEKEGFWGNPTSNIDWCEDNYQLSPYVAEFWNALSSFFLCGIFYAWNVADSQISSGKEVHILFPICWNCWLWLRTISFHSASIYSEFGRASNDIQCTHLYLHNSYNE